MLSTEAERAAAIAAELDRANQERRAVEREALEAAERERAALPDELRDGAGLVLAGEGWHPGVVGIVASRMVERHWQPVVLLAVEGDRARGSARSIPGFDLVAAFEACSEHLARFGGHQMAAGLELEAARIEPFRRAFLAHATDALDQSALVRADPVDALVGVGPGGLGLPLAEQLERLAPFGVGNPEPRLLVPAAELDRVRPMGEEGRHSRFELRSGAGSANGVAFGMNSELAGAPDEAVDVAVRLELDRWNGAVQPRVVLRALHRQAPPAERAPEADGPGCGAEGCPALGESWWRRLDEELGRDPGDVPEAVEATLAQIARQSREVVDRRGGAIVAAIAELGSSGASVLAVCADASRRRQLAARAGDPRRFGGEPAPVACGRCGEVGLGAALGEPTEAPEPIESGLVLADWSALAQRPAAARRFEHVVVVDPPPRLELDSLVRTARTGPGGTSPFAAGFLHQAWGAPELELAERCLAGESRDCARQWRSSRCLCTIGFLCVGGLIFLISSFVLVCYCLLLVK